MKNVTVYNDSGKKVEDIALEPKIFGLEPNEKLVAMALRYQQNNARKSISHTKTRGEVNGSGKKPYRQKGTGRARRGSDKSPLLIGGGIVFGPRSDKNYEIAMPKKQRRKALFCALSQKLANEGIFILDEYTKKEVKTKDFAKLHSQLPINKKLLIVVDQKNEVLEKSARNVEGVRVIDARYLNIFEILKYQSVCFLKKALPVVESTFLK